MQIAVFIMLGVGGFILILGVIFFFVGKRNHPYESQTMGYIVDMCMNAYNYNSGGGGNTKMGIYIGGTGAGNRCPIFEYTVHGITYRRADNISWNISYINKKMGQKIPVFYNPQNPAQATLSKISPLKIIGIVFTSVGLFCVVLGGIFLAV